MNASHHVVVVYGLGAHVGPRVQGGGGGLGCTVLMYSSLSRRGRFSPNLGTELGLNLYEATTVQLPRPTNAIAMWYL